MAIYTKQGTDIVQMAGVAPPKQLYPSPDVDNMETVNRFSGSSGSWTVDRDGYVAVCVDCTGAGTQGAFVNGKKCLQTVGRANPNNDYTSGVLQVSAGDIVSFVSWQTTTLNYCYFIPIKWSAVNVNYVYINLANEYPPVGVEQDTGKKWFDGRIIYRKTYQNVSISASSAPATWVNTSITGLPATLFPISWILTGYEANSNTSTLWGFKNNAGTLQVVRDNTFLAQTWNFLVLEYIR